MGMSKRELDHLPELCPQEEAQLLYEISKDKDYRLHRIASELDGDTEAAEAVLVLIEDSDAKRVLKEIADALTKLERVARNHAELSLSQNSADIANLLASGKDRYNSNASKHPSDILWRFYESRYRRAVVENGSPV